MASKKTNDRHPMKYRGEHMSCNMCHQEATMRCVWLVWVCDYCYPEFKRRVLILMGQNEKEVRA